MRALRNSLSRPIYNGREGRPAKFSSGYCPPGEIDRHAICAAAAAGTWWHVIEFVEWRRMGTPKYIINNNTSTKRKKMKKKTSFQNDAGVDIEMNNNREYNMWKASNPPVPTPSANPFSIHLQSRGLDLRFFLVKICCRWSIEIIINLWNITHTGERWGMKKGNG